MIRSAGILLPVTALPSPYGIGTMGKDAREFIDFLAEAGQTYWQILPLGPTGFGNSPYQALSSYAGNIYLIDLDRLIDTRLLKKTEVSKIKWGKKPDAVDYGILYNERMKVLRKATRRLAALHPQEYLDFLRQESGWLRDYAVFMAIKQDQKGAAWQTWPKELRDARSEAVRNEAYRLREDVMFWQRVQFLFFRQLKDMKEYANRRGIQIIGDLPFYIAADSIDVWAHPEQFEIDGEHQLTFVSGFGPDNAHPDGQKWGNPLFNWDLMRSQNYSWWLERAAFTAKYCDVLRIDHFQGYLSYYAVPAKDENARNGQWRRGPGLEVFRKLEERIGKKQIIVEDLGQLTPEFLDMVAQSGYPGMRIMEYAFDPNDPGSLYTPFQYPKNSVVYTGTHDNDTLQGWLDNPDNKARIERAKKYLGLNKEEGYADGVLRGVYASASDLAIVQMQDLLGLGSAARTNDPSGKSVPWTWRCLPGSFNKKTAAVLKEKMLLYCRNNWSVHFD